MRKLLMVGMIAILLVASVLANDIAIDDFESDSFSGGTGWNGAWTYIGNCEITTLSNPLGTYHMRGSANCNVSRQFDDSSYDEVNVTFYATATSLEVGEYCRYYYNDGTTDHLLLELTDGDDDGSHDYYNFNITGYGLNTGAGIRVVTPITTGDYCYIDNITIVGEGTVTLNIFTDNEYLSGAEDVEIEVSSSATSTSHTIELKYPNGTIFCSDVLSSPAVPYTAFSTYCNMPNGTFINATSLLYLTSDSGINTEKKFNITQAQQDEGRLNIKKVYFSPQVLQGGSTEIFAIIQKTSDITVDNIYVTITFPDSSKRVLNMQETSNTNEYRAFITDTYQVGTVYFNVRAEGGIYFDTYNNNYDVAAYNLDFVDVVNSVNEVLVCQEINESGMDIFGTEYEIYEHGTIFLQLRDGEGLPVNDGDCHLDIYYPNTVNESHSVWITDGPMLYKTGSDGIYYYDINLGNITGVYMMGATCAYAYSGVWAYTDDSMEDVEYQAISGSYSGSTHNLINHEDFLYMQCTSAGGAQKACEAYYHFNISHINTTNTTDINLYYSGEASTTAVLTFYVYNWTSGTWITLNNTLTYSGASPSSNPIGINDFVSNSVPVSDTISPVNDTILIRLRSTSGAVYTQFNNWLNMKIMTAQGVVYDLKGGGEIHVSDSMTQMGWTILSLINGVPQQVWNFTPRNLTYYEDVTNYSLGSEYVWNYTTRELTYYPNNTEATISGVWGYDNRTLTDSQQLWVGNTEYSVYEKTGKIVVRAVDVNGEPLTGAECRYGILYPNGSVLINNTLMTEHTGAIQGAYTADFNLTGVVGVYPYGIDCTKLGKDYYFLNTFHVFAINETAIAEDVWNYTTRNLTYYTNNTQATIDGIWSYNNRTLTNASNVAVDIWSWDGTVNANLIAQFVADIWSYVARYTHGIIS